MWESVRRLLLPRPEFVRRLSRGQVLISIALASSLIGATGWVALGTFVELTSTTEFCMSCHEMMVMREELSKTVHFKNRTGVRLGCSDCHVPQGAVNKFIAKIEALDDVYAHLIGTVDTPAKFEARRWAMANTVWAEMKATGSRACRACHAFEAMEFAKQADRPKRKHNDAMNSGETCIDCHKGIAHALPKEPRD